MVNTDVWMKISDNERKIVHRPGRARPARMGSGTWTDATDRTWPEDADGFMRSVRTGRYLEKAGCAGEVPRRYR